MSVNVTLENLSEPVGFRPETLETLWSQIPPGLRTVTWNSPDIPDEFAEGFTRPAGRAPEQALHPRLRRAAARHRP